VKEVKLQRSCARADARLVRPEVLARQRALMALMIAHSPMRISSLRELTSETVFAAILRLLRQRAQEADAPRNT